MSRLAYGRDGCSGRGFHPIREQGVPFFSFKLHEDTRTMHPGMNDTCNPRAHACARGLHPCSLAIVVGPHPEGGVALLEGALSAVSTPKAPGRMPLAECLCPLLMPAWCWEAGPLGRGQVVRVESSRMGSGTPEGPLPRPQCEVTERRQQGVTEEAGPPGTPRLLGPRPASTPLLGRPPPWLPDGCLLAVSRWAQRENSGVPHEIGPHP